MSTSGTPTIQNTKLDWRRSPKNAVQPNVNLCKAKGQKYELKCGLATGQKERSRCNIWLILLLLWWWWTKGLLQGRLALGDGFWILVWLGKPWACAVQGTTCPSSLPVSEWWKRMKKIEKVRKSANANSLDSSTSHARGLQHARNTKLSCWTWQLQSNSRFEIYIIYYI